MTADEKARLDSTVEHAGEIIDKLSAEGLDSPFLKDMKALQDELGAIPDKPDAIPDKLDQDVRRLGEQLGSAISGLVGENATVNVYVTVNGK